MSFRAIVSKPDRERRFGRESVFLAGAWGQTGIFAFVTVATRSFSAVRGAQDRVAAPRRLGGPRALALVSALALAGCVKTPASEDIAPLPGNGWPGAGGGPGASGGGGDEPALASDASGAGTSGSEATGGAAAVVPGDGDVAVPAFVDAASSDAGEPEPVQAVCGSTATCYDFEDGTPGMAPGAPWSGRGSIDSTKAFSGGKSLHVSAGGDDAFATMAAPFFPVANNEYFGRVMVWTADVPGAHWTFIRSRGKSAEKGFAAEYTYGGSGKTIIANYDTPNGPASDCWKDGGQIPLGRWVCMEWHFKGASNELELWIDGVPDTAHVVGKGDGCVGNGTGKVWYAPTFTNLQLGYAVYGGAAGHKVWFDDLALSASSRIGCPAAP